MLTLALTLPLLLASAGEECYFVTNEEIEAIPCNFDAAVTDALRYADEDAHAEERQRRREELARRRPPVRTFGQRGMQGARR